MEKLTEILYQREWIAFHAFEESDNPDGGVMLHNKDRRAFDKELLKQEINNVYITFAAPPVPPKHKKPDVPHHPFSRIAIF